MVLETLWVPVGTGAVRPIWKKFSAAGAAQRLTAGFTQASTSSEGSTR